MIKNSFFKLSTTLYASAMLAGGCFNGDAHALTLQEALSKSYSFNPNLKAEISSLEATNEQLPQAYSGFLPTVSANYSRSRDEETLTNSSSTAFPEARSLTITQPIFNGFDSWYQVKQAKSNISLANNQLRSTEQQVLTNAIVVYIDVVRTSTILELSKNNEAVLAEQLQATKDNFTLGETTRTDVSQAETRLAVASADRIEAEGAYIKAKAEFLYIIGTSAPENLQMPVDLPTIPDDFQAALDIALANNPTIKIAEYREISSKNAVRRAKSQLLPTISATGSMSRQSGLSSTRISQDIDNDKVTLNVSIPLYQAGGEYSKVRQSKKNMQNATFLLEEARNQIISDTTNSWQQVLTTKAKVAANTTSVDSARIALEGVREEKDVGSRTTLDVLNAEQELFIAQVNLVTAIRNSVLAVYNVKAAMGELTAQNLNLDVDSYNPEDSLDDVKYKFIGF